MIALGIDPGSRTTGYGIVQQKGSQFIHIDNGCLTTRTSASMAERLTQIYTGLLEVIEKYSPDVVAVEEVFFGRINPGSSLRLGESRGIALLAGGIKGLPVAEYSTREVKQAITGYGQATKDQMQQMIKRLLKLPEIAQEDASDALAVALCHLQSAKLRRLSA